MSIGTNPLTEMMIDTGTSDPVSQKPYPIAIKNYQWVKDEIEKLLNSKGHTQQQIQLVRTHNHSPKGRWRKMFNYHSLNKVTRKFTWPMPKVEVIFSKLNAA